MPCHYQKGALSQDAYEDGIFVSADQFVVNTPGRLLSGNGHEESNNQFHDRTMFHDAATAENQVSLGAREKMAKEYFNQ